LFFFFFFCLFFFFFVVFFCFFLERGAAERDDLTCRTMLVSMLVSAMAWALHTGADAAAAEAPRQRVLANLALPLTKAALPKSVAAMLDELDETQLDTWLAELLATGLDRGRRARHLKVTEEQLKAHKELVFINTEVEIPLTPPLIDHGQHAGDGQGIKNLAGRPERGAKCIVYGGGISKDASFEQKMGELGCEVHGFDCTINSPPKPNGDIEMKWTWHNWCLGVPDESGALPWGSVTRYQNKPEAKRKLTSRPCQRQ